MKKYLLGAVVLAVGVVTMAFTNEDEPVRNTTIYQFQGDEASEMRTLSLWAVVEAPVEGCEVGDLPCYVETDVSISSWLNSRSDTEIVEDATGKKF